MSAYLASLVPLANLVPMDVDGRVLWQCGGNDPQFGIRCGSDGAALPAAGWHLVEVQLAAVEGGVESPCLYPDYGAGCSELDKIGLAGPDADGWIRAVVLFKHPLHSLRFDPSTGNPLLRVGELRLVRLGRIGALLKMLGFVWRNPHAGPGEAARLAWRSLASVAAGRPSEAGERVLSRYQRLLVAGPSDYEHWLLKHDRPLAADVAAQRVAAMARPPLVSIVMPVYNTPERWLRACIDSVLRQSYPHWELCIADDASPSRATRKVLEDHAARDPRVRVVFRASNGHISAASNSAMEIARGEWMALLDHDDLLHPDALLHVVEAIVANPEAKIVYTDEDKVDERGRRYQPYFKPAFDPDLLRGQNVICHLGVYRLDHVRAIGGFRLGFEGSQDWDLALRTCEALPGTQVVHVPRVLYHWRAIAGSTALASGEKSYTSGTGLKSVSEHLARIGMPADASILPGGHVRVRPRPVSPEPRVLIVIPTRDRVDLVRQCIDSVLERSTYRNYHIALVDNGSVEPESLQYFSEVGSDERVTVIPYPHPFNYSAINNFAVDALACDVVLLLNNDIEVISPEWLEEMVALAMRPDAGAVGAMLYYPDDTVQHAGVTIGIGGVAGHAFTGAPREAHGYMGRMRLTHGVLAVTAACLAIRRSTWDAMGGLDTGLQVAFNDVDFCLRVADAGYRNLWSPNAQLYHHESASRGYEDTPEKKDRFKREVDFMLLRWGDALSRDPSYSPNLSLTAEPFTLGFPPRGQQARLWRLQR